MRKKDIIRSTFTTRAAQDLAGTAIGQSFGAALAALAGTPICTWIEPDGLEAYQLTTVRGRKLSGWLDADGCLHIFAGPFPAAR